MKSCSRIGLSILFCLVAAPLVAQPVTTPPTTAPTKSFTYKKVNGVELEMIVHFPTGWKASDKRPAIVLFFGGSYCQMSWMTP